MLEKQIEAAVCKYAREKGIEAYKFSSPARVGVPDRMFMAPFMRLFFIEFKREGGKPTPVQEREALKISACGFSVYLVDSVEQGKEIIDSEAECAVMSRDAALLIRQAVANEEGTRH